MFGLMGALNSNLAMLPLTDYPGNYPGNYPSNYPGNYPGNYPSNQLNRIMNDSLMESASYKKILSEKGKKQLKIIKYSKDRFDQNYCCVTFEDFKEGQDVTQLPCRHIFATEGITTWLVDESSKCPVCRFELDFTEVRDSTPEQTIESTDISYNVRSLGFINPFEYFDSQTFVNEIISEGNQYLVNRNLQNAIIASFYEQNDFSDEEYED